MKSEEFFLINYSILHLASRNIPVNCANKAEILDSKFQSAVVHVTEFAEHGIMPNDNPAL